MKKALYLIIKISISLSIFSCGLSYKASLKKNTVENGAIPADFGKDNQVLLCIKRDGNNILDTYNKRLAKYVEESYHGDYEIIERSELANPRFSDYEKYPYCFDSEMKYIYTPSGSQSVVKCFILDRISNKKYTSDWGTSVYSSLIKGYMENLELTRLKNK